MLSKITNLGYRLLPERMMETAVGRRRNRIMKTIKPRDKYYVLSDTHTPEIDLEKKFINTGCIVENLTTYLIIDEKGAPKLIKEFKEI